MGVPAPGSLGPRGARLWAALAADRVSLGGAEAVLLEEACRLADRLDKLDAQLRGSDDEWLRVVQPRDDDGGEVIVVVDKALSEARQQQIALKQVLAELRQSGPAVPAKPGGDGVGIAALAALIADPAAPTPA